MAFGAYSTMINKFKVFANTAFDKRVLVDEIETQTDLIKTRLRKSFSTFPTSSSGGISATGNLLEDEEIVIDDRTFRFKATPTAIDDIDIGSDTQESLDNLHSAIEKLENGGCFTGTDLHTSVESTVGTLALALTARKAGVGGNSLALTTTSSSIVITAFTGGANEVKTLSTLSLQMSVLALLAGKAISAQSGSGNKPLMTSLEFKIKTTWEVLDEANYLFTVEGGEIESDSMCPIGTAVEYDPDADDE